MATGDVTVSAPSTSPTPADGPAPARVRLRGLTKRYDRRAAADAAAVDGIDLDVADGEILSLLGPSGCGKTTTLRCIAGFETPDAGTIELAGRTVAGDGVDVPPDKRRVGMVFQDYALFPHLDVAGNIAFGLDGIRGGPGRRGRARRDPRVLAACELVGLAGLEARMPRELSGGQQQRVALARALAPEPDLVLLDEPFSNLDTSLRQQVRADVERILRDAGATAIFVTHAQDEALSIADRVAVMRAGRVVQTGTPTELYRHPVDAFVAGFIADAVTVEAVRCGDDASRLRAPFGIVHAADGVLAGTAPDATCTVFVRPEHVTVAPAADGDCRVVDRVYYGHDEELTVRTADGTVLRARIDAATAARTPMAPGDRVTIAVTLGPGDVLSPA